MFYKANVYTNIHRGSDPRKPINHRLCSDCNAVNQKLKKVWKQRKEKKWFLLKFESSQVGLK